MLKIEKKKILSADFGALSSLPPVSVKLSLSDISDKFCLDEDDGLYINYGSVECAYPYRYQDMYTRDLTEKEYDSIILENDFLRATFMPDFGGKLWSLYDKKQNKELLFENSVVRPCNLAVRNAWLSGGIEWNCGFKGHHAYTCSLISTAQTQLDDGTPVLRFYYFERIRCVVVQMDFFLPDNSAFLCCRMRITNPNTTVVPMYWWSNVAVCEKEGNRVIVPAHKSYTAPNGYVEKIPIPEYNGIDVTYPRTNVVANDYFWCTENNTRKYIFQADRSGYGLCQCSTSRLKGRKLFVWGNSQGGKKWQNFLTDDRESGSYNEIQCGLANTQYECLPMPPHTVWEWLECYGPMQTDASAIHDTWADARNETEKTLETLLPENQVENLLADTLNMAKSPAKKVLYHSEGWGALELERRKTTCQNLMCDHLDFGNTGAEQKDWLNLLRNQTIGEHNPEDIPTSYMLQKEWLSMLESSIKDKDALNWYAYYLLGTAEIALENFEKSEKYLKKSLELEKSAWAYYALAVCHKKTGNISDCIKCMTEAYSIRKSDISLAKEVYRCLFEQGLYDEIICRFETETQKIRSNERCLLYYAYALAKTGKIHEAEDIICQDGKYLVVPDIRECELTITDLWYFIQQQKGTENPGDPPYDLDFRMTANMEEWFNDK